MEGPNNFDRRGLLDLPVSLPSIPLVNPLVTPLVGGPKPEPTPSPPPQQDSSPPASAPTPTPDLGIDSVLGNGGNGDNIAAPLLNPGNGNTSGPNPSTSPNLPSPSMPSPNLPSPNTPSSNLPPPNSPSRDPSPNLPTPNSPAPNSPAPNSPAPGSPSPSLNGDPQNTNSPNPPNSSPTSESSLPQSSGGPQNGSVHLSESDSQEPDSGNPPDDPSDPGNVAFTTVSGTRTEVTQVPHSGGKSPEDGSTGGDGSNTVNGSGNGPGGGGNSPVGRGLGPGIIAAIVIGAALALALFVFFLRKRVKKRRAAQRTRWLSDGEKGLRNTVRSSFGDLRASCFGYPSGGGHDVSDRNSYSGPFSDTVAVLLPSHASPTSSTSTTPQMTQITHTDITPPAIAVHSTGRRSNRNSEFSIGSAGSGETDGSEGQWLEIHPSVRYGNNGEMSPIDQHCLPSPISVRPFSPSESWSFPKPPHLRAKSFVHSSDSSKGFLAADPFADPVPQPPPAGSPPVETVTRTFEPEAADELAIEIDDEVSVLKVFDDGWAMVKVLSRNGRPESVQGLEGHIPIDCLRPRGDQNPLFASPNLRYTTQQASV